MAHWTFHVYDRYHKMYLKSGPVKTSAVTTEMAWVDGLLDQAEANESRDGNFVKVWLPEPLPKTEEMLLLVLKRMRLEVITVNHGNPASAAAKAVRDLLEHADGMVKSFLLKNPDHAVDLYPVKKNLIHSMVQTKDDVIMFKRVCKLHCDLVPKNVVVWENLLPLLKHGVNIMPLLKEKIPDDTLLQYVKHVEYADDLVNSERVEWQNAKLWNVPANLKMLLGKIFDVDALMRALKKIPNTLVTEEILADLYIGRPYAIGTMMNENLVDIELANKLLQQNWRGIHSAVSVTRNKDVQDELKLHALIGLEQECL